MNPERWRQIDQVFHGAVELEPAERAAFLEEACSGDPVLRDTVEAMLASDDSGWDSISRPAWEVAAAMLSSDEPQLAPGQTIGRYEIISLVGRGGMGEVYLAKDGKLNRRIALKLLPLDFTRDKDRLRRFQQEAQAASALNHPNILTIHELGEVDERQFIATEFVEGETLRQRMQRDALTLTEAVDIAIQIASALYAAHTAGIVHRDIKPENIMLRPDGYVKVLDFGLAKLTEQYEHPSHTGLADNPEISSGLVLGTVKYMSPEQARGQQVDPRSDIFSFGAVLYEMVAGRAPFQGKTAGELISAVLREEPLQPSNAPDAVGIIIRKALCKNREARYQSVEELLIDLENLKEALDLRSKLRRPAQSALSQQTIAILPDTKRKGIAATKGPAVGGLIRRLRQHWAAAGLVLAALLVAAVAVSLAIYRFSARSRANLPFLNLDVTKLTNFGDGWAPSISPDGKYVVYAKNQEYTYNQSSDPAVFSLWLRDLDSKSDVQILPRTFGRCYTTTFSRDGNHIYYGVGAGEPIKLFVIPTSGGNPTEVLNRTFPVSLSPDGNLLAYLDSNPTEGKTSVVIANSDGSEQHEIVSRQEANYFRRTVKPSWSPNGKLIACVGQDRGKSFPHLFLVDIETRTTTPLTAQKWTDIRGVEWLPDMSGLLLVAAEETSSVPQIWQVSYPGGQARRITNDALNYSGLGLSADGKAMVTTGGEIPTSIWIMPVAASHSKNSKVPITVDTSKARQIAVANLTNRDDLNNLYERMSWTPDGRIVYMSKDSGNADIWSMKSDGSDRKQLTTDLHSDSDSVVSPDGRYIAFVSNRAGAENVWIMDADGRNQRRLTSQFIERSPDFSGDSRWVFFNSWETGKATIWKVAVEGGEPIPVLDYPSFFPMISPDGSLLAFIGDKTNTSGVEEIFVAPSAGGSPIGSFVGNFLLNWTPNGKGLTYPWNGPILGQPLRSVFNIWEQPLDGGEPRQLTNFPEAIFVHAWSRDGKQLAVLTARYISDVVMMSSRK